MILYDVNTGKANVALEREPGTNGFGGGQALELRVGWWERYARHWADRNILLPV